MLISDHMWFEFSDCFLCPFPLCSCQLLLLQSYNRAHCGLFSLDLSSPLTTVNLMANYDVLLSNFDIFPLMSQISRMFNSNSFLSTKPLLLYIYYILSFPRTTYRGSINTWDWVKRWLTWLSSCFTSTMACVQSTEYMKKMLAHAYNPNSGETNVHVPRVHLSTDPVILKTWNCWEILS